jgi:hypothetical protein
VKIGPVKGMSKREMDSCRLYVPQGENEQDCSEESCQSQGGLDVNLLSPRHRIFVPAHIYLFTTTTGKTLARTIEVKAIAASSPDRRFAGPANFNIC